MPEQNPAAESTPPLKSVHSTTFPALLARLGASIWVTTYQAGKLVVLRADDGVLNTHFRSFPKPMGLAIHGGRFALGCRTFIMEFRNNSKVALKLEPTGKHDACYLPHAMNVTGDVAIHEMAWVDQDLWFVNTRFSCLATRSSGYSFRPQWRPPFITELSPEDRCHLNGMGLRDGRPRYVTALGRTNATQGWRNDKAFGGILMDIENGKFLAEGLSMPHSPRWHDGRLWVLESGKGELGTVDPSTGTYETVAVLPGFTRGLDFAGPYAFVGLSQVRETATFSGIPITESQEERSSGVWVVDTRDGRIVALVKFEAAVQEIFAVQVLPGRRFPELLNEDEEFIAQTFTLPDESLKDVPSTLL